MPNDRLTEFLVALAVDNEVRKDYEANNDAVLRRFDVDADVIKTLLDYKNRRSHELFGTQEAGGSERAREANHLARKAAVWARSDRNSAAQHAKYE